MSALQVIIRKIAARTDRPGRKTQAGIKRVHVLIIADTHKITTRIGVCQ